MLDRFNPFAEMSRLEDEFLGGRGERRMTFQPLVDIYEEKDAIVVKAELPGVKPDELSIQIENSVLTLSGKRQLEREDKRESYHRIERSYGSFTRSFVLPNTVDSAKISAEMEAGVLTLKLPRKPEAQPRRIEIKAAGKPAPRQLDVEAQSHAQTTQDIKHDNGKQQRT